VGELIPVGKTLRLDSGGTECAITAYLGGGGQGEVYKVRLAGADMALKWYFRRTATEEQRQTLEELVRLGAPTKRFLWPVQVAAAAAIPGFGYIMPLRSAPYRSMFEHVTRKVRPTWRAQATTGYQLADSFFQLHAMGLSYRDISFGNVFFDPASGDTLICDNDNVGVDGKAGGIAGTPRFMAPEIARGDGSAQPNTETDLFSLAVLLFYLFIVHHPLEGAKEASIRCMDSPAMQLLYGQEPVFIFDPHDRSNAPVKGFHDNAFVFWPLYPQFLRDLFTRVFTEGIREPQQRVRENEWRNAMIRLRDSIYPCAWCGRENFYGGPGVCAWCRKPLANPMRLRLAKDMEPVLCTGAQLYAYHLENSRSLGDVTFKDPVAEVVRHPINPNFLGLRNLSTASWAATLRDGSMRQVEPGKSVTISAGLRVNFGGREGLVLDS